MLSWHGKLQKEVVTFCVVRVFLYFIIRVVFLALMQQLGQRVKVKTKILANNDLIIVGLNNEEQEIFAFTIKNKVSVTFSTQEFSKDDPQHSQYSESEADDSWLVQTQEIMKIDQPEWKYLDAYQAEQLNFVSRLVSFDYKGSMALLEQSSH